MIGVMNAIAILVALAVGALFGAYRMRRWILGQAANRKSTLHLGLAPVPDASGNLAISYRITARLPFGITLTGGHTQMLSRLTIASLMEEDPGPPAAIPEQPDDAVLAANPGVVAMTILHPEKSLAGAQIGEVGGNAVERADRPDRVGEVGGVVDGWRQRGVRAAAESLAKNGVLVVSASLTGGNRKRYVLNLAAVEATTESAPPARIHVWEVKTSDHPTAGEFDFWVCERCDANLGLADGRPLSPPTPPYRSLVSGTAIDISEDCSVAKQQLRDVRRAREAQGPRG